MLGSQLSYNRLVCNLRVWQPLWYSQTADVPVNYNRSPLPKRYSTIPLLVTRRYCCLINDSDKPPNKNIQIQSQQIALTKDSLSDMMPLTENTTRKNVCQIASSWFCQPSQPFLANDAARLDSFPLKWKMRAGFYGLPLRLLATR